VNPFAQDREADERAIEAQFRRVVEHLPVVVYIESMEGGPGVPGTLLYASPQIEALLGITAREWMEGPLSWTDLLHPDDRDRVRAECERAVANDAPFTATEYRMCAPDGRIVWIRDEAQIVRDEEGRPLHWQGIMIDITQRKAEEERGRATEEKFRTLVEQLPAIVYREDISEDGLNVTYVSPFIKELLGSTRDEWIANPDSWANSVHPDDREVVTKEYDRTAESREPFSMEYRMIAKDGRVVWVQDEARVVSEGQGKGVHWQGVITDVTRHKRAEELEHDLLAEKEASERLREADDLKNTLLRAVSHDLRTPLAAILGIASTLARPDLELPSEERRELSERIAVNARRLDRMVTDMLDLDRMSRGALQPAFAPVDAGRLVRDLVAGSDLVTGRRLQLDTAPLTVPADAAMLERIVENLLGNSAKHTPGDSRIWVRVERVDEGVQIVVEDDGPGVPPEDRDRIFETFARGASTTSNATAVRSTGVGLAVVKRFAELHGGRAWVEDREGGGASFHVTLSDDPARAADDSILGAQPAATALSSSEASQA
jgi:PAS domain S-box-containing protein